MRQGVPNHLFVLLADSRDGVVALVLGGFEALDKNLGDMMNFAGVDEAEGAMGSDIVEGLACVPEDGEDDDILSTAVHRFDGGELSPCRIWYSD
jgi:hypothetical protein